MNNDRNFYEVLGVREDAMADDIKAAFRRLALAHHPDRNRGDHAAEARFKIINEAYSVLGDPSKRTAYDEELASARSAEAAARLHRLASEAANRVVNENQHPAQPPAAVQVPATRPARGWGAFFAVLGAGLAAAMASAGSSETWDSRAGRYRGPDGRFTSG